MIKWIKNKIAEYKYKRKMKKKLEELKKKDPFIYDQKRNNNMAHSVEQVYDKIKILHTKGLMLHRERYRTAGSYDKEEVQYMLDDIRALAGDIQHGLVDLDIEFSKTGNNE